MKNAQSNVNQKRLAGVHASKYVESGMLVGLGTGSTTAFAVHELGRRIREENLSIRCVATSYSTLMFAVEEGLPLIPLHSVSRLDISIDGADEFDSELNLIKGGGAAHTQEKLVHAMSDRFIVVADPSKRVERLGARFPIPVEVIRESVGFVTEKLKEMGASSVSLRIGAGKDGPVVTDNGNFVLDMMIPVVDPGKLELELNSIPGALENGIFSIGRIPVDRVVVGSDVGVEEILGRR